MSKPLPGWADAPVESTPGGAVFPIPAEWKSPVADRFAVTVVFEDTGDIGPVVEWRSRSGDVQRISEGLGESDQALGLHARTMVLPSELTANGGAIIVSMPWRPEGLVSAAIQPVRDVTVAVTGSGFDPGLIDRAGQVEREEELRGVEVPGETGDFRRGPVIEAELAGGVEMLTHELEFAIPVDGAVEGAVLRSEVLGLDPSAAIEVVVNNRLVGKLNGVPFALDDPAVIMTDGRLQLAGWRRHSVYIPGTAWRRGDNSLVLRHAPAAMGPTAPLALKRTYLQLRFAPESSMPAPLQVVDVPSPLSGDNQDLWDVGPDFTTPVSFVDEPPPLPTVSTSPGVPPSRGEESAEVEESVEPAILPAVTFARPKIPIEGPLPVDDE